MQKIPISCQNIRLPIGIMLSRLIIYHDNLADWTFSLLSHMLMSNNSLTTRRIGHYKQLIQQKVQSFQISQQFWTFYLILLLVRSNPPHFLTQFGLSHASSPLQRPIRHHSSTAYYTPPANPRHKSLPWEWSQATIQLVFKPLRRRRHLVSWDSWLNANESQRT